MTQSPTLVKVQAQPVYEITPDDKKRQEDIRLAWQAYDGDLEPPLKRMPGEPDDNVLSNRMAPIVDAGVDFLFGKEIEISVEEGAPAEAQQALDDAWGIKEARLPLLQDVAMNGAMARRAFLRIVPNKDGSEFRLVAVDPGIVCVKTAPQDCETVLLYCLEYSETDKDAQGHPQTIYYREEIQRIDPDGNSLLDMPDDDDTWSIQHWTRRGTSGPWNPAGAPIVWPYNFPPLFSCKNLPRPNDFWGRADIRPDLIRLNNALNLTLSSANRLNKIFGGPLLYSNGVGEGTTDAAPGRIMHLPLIDSKITAVQIHSDIPGSLALASELISHIDELSGTPGVAMGRLKDMPRGNMSGIAIELTFMSLIMKTIKKQMLYGAMIIAVSKAILVLNHMSADIEITIAWQSPIPHDALPDIQAAIAKLELDISKTTLQRELNYDPEEEANLKKSEDEIAMQRFAQGAGMPVAADAGIPAAQVGAPALPGQKYPMPAPGGQAPAAPQGGGN